MDVEKAGINGNKTHLDFAESDSGTQVISPGSTVALWKTPVRPAPRCPRPTWIASASRGRRHQRRRRSGFGPSRNSQTHRQHGGPSSQPGCIHSLGQDLRSPIGRKTAKVPGKKKAPSVMKTLTVLTKTLHNSFMSQHIPFLRGTLWK